MKNKKVDRIKFVKEAKAKIEALGMKVVEQFSPFDGDLKRYQYRNRKCLITLHEQHGQNSRNLCPSRNFRHPQ